MKLPHLVLQLKTLADRKAHFSVEVTLADDTGATRNLRASNYVSETRITVMQYFAHWAPRSR